MDGIYTPYRLFLDNLDVHSAAYRHIDEADHHKLSASPLAHVGLLRINYNASLGSVARVKIYGSGCSSSLPTGSSCWPAGRTTSATRNTPGLSH